MASRSENQGSSQIEEEQEFKLTPPIVYPKPKRILIIDGDSIPYIVSYTGKDELGNKKPEYLESEYHIAEGLATEVFMKIVVSCEEFFEISNVFLCIKGSKDNPRHLWLPTYKQNRPPSLPIIRHIQNFLITSQKGISAIIGETDDLVAEISQQANCLSVIATIDKDVLQTGCGNWFLDYRKWEWKYITKERADYLFNYQWVVNDASDNIKLTKGIGDSFAKKVIKEGMSPFEYMEGVYKAYIKVHKTHEKALENMQLAWKLLKLHTVKEFEDLEMSNI